MQSKNPRSTEGGAEHDEDLLRYVLVETTAGASGNERWGPGFREEVSSRVSDRFLLGGLHY